MKTKFYLRLFQVIILVISGLTMNAPAQSFNWEFANGYGMGSADAGRCLTADHVNCMFMAGEYEEMMMDPAGNPLLPPIAQDCNDIFLFRYDPAGNLMLAKSMGNSYSGPGSPFSQFKYVKSMAAGNPGLIYITGSFSQGIGEFEPHTVYNSDDGSDMFIAQVDENSGLVNWIRTAYQPYTGFAFDASGCDVVADMLGNVYVIGNFTNQIIFDNVTGIIPVPVSTTVILTAQCQDAFIAKYNIMGDCIWVKQVKGNVIGGFNYGNAIDVDNQGNVYATGSFMSSATFDTRTLVSTGVDDIFLAKYDANGNLKWALNEGGHCHNSGMDVLATDDGKIFITGFFQGTDKFGGYTLTSAGAADIFMARYTSAGKCTSARRMGNVQDDFGYRLELYNNRLWLMAFYAMSVNVGPYKLISPAGTDYFLAEFDPVAGTAIYAENLVSSRTGLLEAEDLAITQSGDVYVTGYYDSDATFSPWILPSSVAGSQDAFVAKLPFSSTKEAIADNAADTLSAVFTVFPNPVSDNLNIRMTEPAGAGVEVAIISMTGQQVVSTEVPEGESQFSASLSELRSGVYQCVLTRQGVVIDVERIIVK